MTLKNKAKTVSGNKTKGLRPFQKGQSGNPKGRPKKGETMTDALRLLAAQKITDEKGNAVTFKDAIAKKLYFLAVSGDIAAIKYIFDRIDGFPTQAIQQQDEDGKPIIPRKVVFEVVEAKHDTGDTDSKAVSGDNDTGTV